MAQPKNLSEKKVFIFPEYHILHALAFENVMFTTRFFENEVYIYIHTLHKSQVQKLTVPEAPRTNNLKSMHGSTQICDFVHMSFLGFENVMLTMWF